MDRGGDETTPLVMAEGLAARLMPSAGPLHGLTSDTTRQAGLVSNSDVAPTVLGFFGLPIPSPMAGQRIRPTGDPPPFDLHRQELEMRRIRLPLQLGEVAFVAAAGIIASIALIVLALRGSMPRRPSAALRFMSLCGAAFGVPLLAGGFLPRFTYAVVVPFLVISVLGLAGLSLLFRRPHPLGPFAFIGLVGLAFMAVEAVLGGRAFRTPLFGGTMFDGIRFYGLTNSFIALLLASALFVAFRLDPFPGFLLVVAAGLFGGFPRLGANLGAAAELFVAAAMWWVLRGRRRFGVGEALFAIGVVLAGIGTVLLVNRFAPGAPTHITRFVEQTGQGAGGALGAIGHRLGVGLHQLVGYPTAFIPLVGLVVVLILALREPAFVRAAVALDPPWSEVLIVLTGASLIGYFLNDTGASAAAPCFLYAMSALTYPSFLVAASRTMPGPLGSVLPHHLGRGRRRVGREAPAESSEVSEAGSGRKQPPPRGPERG